MMNLPTLLLIKWGSICTPYEVRPTLLAENPQNFVFSKGFTNLLNGELMSEALFESSEERSRYPLLITWGPISEADDFEVSKSEDVNLLESNERKVEVAVVSPMRNYKNTPLNEQNFDDNDFSDIPINEIEKIYDTYRDDLLKTADQKAYTEHLQGIRRKRSLKQTIDECLADDMELHTKATTMRLAFEHEASLWHTKIQMTVEQQRRAGHIDGQVPFIYSFDESGNPSTPPDNIASEIEISTANQSDKCTRPLVNATDVEQPVSKRIRRFVSPSKYNA